MAYLVSQISFWLAAAALVGLGMGWLFWGRLAFRRKVQVAEMGSRLAQLEPLPVQVIDLQESHRTALAEREASIERLRKRVSELEPLTARLTELESSAIEKDVVAAQLRGRIAELESRHASAAASQEQARLEHTEQMARRDGRIAQLETALEECHSRYSAAMADAAAQQHRLEARVQGLQAELAESGDVEDRLHAAMNELELRILELSPAAVRVPDLEAELRRMTEAHELNVAAREAQVGGLRQQLAALGEVHASAIAAHESETGQLRRELGELSAERDSQAAALASLNDMAGQLREQLETLIPAHRAVEAGRDEVVRRVAAPQTGAAVQNALIAELRAGAVSLRETLAMAEAQRDAHAEAVMEKDALIGDLERQVAALEDAHAAASRQLDSQQAALAGLTLQLCEARKAAAVAEAEAQAIRPLAAAAAVGAGSAANLVSIDSVREDRLRIELADRDAEIAALRNRLDDAEPRAAEIAALHNRLEDEITERDREIVDLRLKLLELENQPDPPADDLGELILLRDRVRSLAGRERELEHGLEERDAAISVLMERLAATPAESPATLKRLDELERHSNNLDTSLAVKDRQMADLQIRLTAIEQAASHQSYRQMLAAKDAELQALRGILQSMTCGFDHDEVARVAYGFAVARNFQGGSSEEDWLRAESLLRQRRLNSQLSRLDSFRS